MSDISTRWNTATGFGDWLFSAGEIITWTDEAGGVIVDELGRPVSEEFATTGTLVSGDDLFTAVLISLFTDAEAGTDDIITDGSEDPRGWWGGAIGSKIWLRLRGKKLPTTLALVRHDIEQALAWLIEDGVAASVTVTTEWTSAGLLGARVVILRSDGTRRALSFARVWETA